LSRALPRQFSVTDRFSSSSRTARRARSLGDAISAASVPSVVPLACPPVLATRQEDRKRVPARPSLRSPCRCCSLLLISASGSVGKDTDRQWSGVRANVIAIQKLRVPTPVLVYYHGKSLVALNADNGVPVGPVRARSRHVSATPVWNPLQNWRESAGDSSPGA
jgi:hypothetical protein